MEHSRKEERPGMGTAPFDGVVEMAVSRLSTEERLRRLEEAKAFLQRALASGPQPAATLLHTASARGIAEGTLYHAKEALGVVSTHQGCSTGSQWIWADPGAHVILSGRSPAKASSSSG